MRKNRNHAARTRTGGFDLKTRLETLAILFRIGRALAGLRRLRPRATGPAMPSSTERTSEMSLLSGYRTYIVAAAMAVFAIAGLLGIEIPSFEGQAPGNLLMEALAIFFLRQGVKSSASKG
jgi:hypothetical protein